MKNLMAVFMLILSVGAFADTYEFTEDELRSYTQTVIENAYDKKDMEIAGIIQSHDLVILDKDKDIELKDAEIEAVSAKNLGLETQVENQGKYIKWTPIIITASVLAGFASGFALAAGSN